MYYMIMYSIQKFRSLLETNYELINYVLIIIQYIINYVIIIVQHIFCLNQLETEIGWSIKL